MFSSILGKRSRNAFADTETTSSEIREREIRAWQIGVVNNVFDKQCLSTVPYNLKSKSTLAILGFYVPPLHRVDGAQIQRLVSFFETIGHEYEITIKWCNKTQNLLVHCLVGAIHEPSPVVSRLTDATSDLSFVRLFPHQPPRLEYEPTAVSVLTRNRIPPSDHARIHDLEQQMISTLWANETLTSDEFPHGDASDVIHHTFERPFVLSVVECPRRVPIAAIQRIQRCKSVEDVWISWDPKIEELVVCVQSRP